MTENLSIKVMIVDDHELVRIGLRTMFDVYDEFEVVAEASTGKQGVEFCQKYEPDVILMDLVMPDMDGAQAIKTIISNHPKVKILALTSFGRPELIRDALQSGAKGYLLKNVSADMLIRAIYDVLDGQTSLAPEVTDSLVKTFTSATRPNYKLTEREQEILKLMSSGLSNPEIAKELVLSLSTVKTHVSNILAKLDVNSRIDAIKVAINQELV